MQKENVPLTFETRRARGRRYSTQFMKRNTKDEAFTAKVKSRADTMEDVRMCLLHQFFWGKFLYGQSSR